jgi:hypothetical protein
MKSPRVVLEVWALSAPTLKQALSNLFDTNKAQRDGASEGIMRNKEVGVFQQPERVG